MSLYKLYYNRLLPLLITVTLILISINLPNNMLKSKAETDEQESNNLYGLSNPVVNNGISTWDCIYFGNYWQNDTNGDGKADQNDEKEPIKWRILSVDGDDAFLLADQCIEAGCRYNHYKQQDIWENSYIRNYLNSDFYLKAFEQDEKDEIAESIPENGKCDNTIDNVFLLKVDDVTNEKYGFSTSQTSSRTRLGTSTKYAIDFRNADQFYNSFNELYVNNWWLRSSESSYSYTDPVDYMYRIVNDMGACNYISNYTSFGIRPAMYVNLSNKNIWSYAGSVSSERSILNEEIAQYAKKIPKLSAEQAKQFLAFVYNDSKYEEVDLTEDKYYKLLTGDLSSYNDDGEQLLADIYAFSMFVRANIDSQLSQSEKNTKYLSDNLIEYFKSELNGMNEVDDQIFNEYKNTWTKRLEDGLTDIMSTELAKHTGIVITEDMFDNIELGISTYNDISSLGDKITTYVKRLCAGVQGFFLPLEKEKLGRYSYFSSYLDNRGNYSSHDDIIFETIMDYNFLAAKENSYISSAIDMTTWITGKDSWSNHREELDEWAEYLYQLESFAKSMYNNEEKQPTEAPTVKPTEAPTVRPTATPTVKPTATPTATPTAKPTAEPTAKPTAKPTAEPTAKPTAEPTAKPTAKPTAEPTAEPTAKPTAEPTAKPTATPTAKPTAEPTAKPTAEPTAKPTVIINEEPTTKTENHRYDFKKVIKLSKVKIKKGATVISGKVSLSGATIKIKVGNKAYKRAAVKGKKFTLKTARLKKKTKVIIKVIKKNYQNLIKVYRVK